MGQPSHTKAKGIVQKYVDYPVLAWRNIFKEISELLADKLVVAPGVSEGLHEECQVLN